MMNINKKWTFGILFTLLATTTAHADNTYGKFELLKSIDTSTLPKQYVLGDVSVELNQKVNNPNYPNQDQLQELFKSQLTEQLTTQKLLAPEGLKVNVVVHYKRIFSGEAFGMSSSFGNSECLYTVTLIQNNEPIAKLDSDASKKTIMEEQKSLFSNLTKLKRLASGTPEDEVNDIHDCVSHLVNHLPQ